MLIQGGQSTLNLERICKDIARITSDNVDLRGQSTLNLERICKDIARITSDNVDPGGGQPTVSLERICKDIARITSDKIAMTSLCCQISRAQHGLATSLNNNIVKRF